MSALSEALLRHNKNTPRYTSYPTAPHFSEAVRETTYLSWLTSLEGDNCTSLYIHIPYCKSICWYCGCNTKATQKYGPVTRFVDLLLKEIALVKSALSHTQSVTNIHFGGGSPSMLTADDFTRIMAHVRDSFDVKPDAEIAIEIDPRELTEAKTAAYALAGVTRVSFGIQDFHEDVQNAIGRRQPFYLVYDAVKLVRSYGIEQINMDLLYGLPHQTAEKMRANINFAQALAPTRVALFGYAHVPWMKKHMQLIDESFLPDAKERLDLFDAASDQLSKKGFHAIGIDHFVRSDDTMFSAHAEGRLRRNFQGYTTDKATTLIGLGVSAIGAMPQGYVQNTPDIRRYVRAVEAGKLPIAKGIKTSPDDMVRRAAIEQLMCYGKLDTEAFYKHHGLPAGYFDDAIQSLAPLVVDGLLWISDGILEVPASLPQASRLVAAAFDAYLKPSNVKHAQVA
ncbi:MAG: oxygen-independent coproporphyrinogen III oxidase [Kordiimonadaceae bacterium]|nr:oxygen-independent coproporphyrinogen III oxidase [Kordiimonadaceae bacterium]MBO6567353.1 oxygen-independent coproporphyrinogen III oxidase [Kordiimonadaceae bacterium]MBO6963433.1 oxygen-independent coproporphyrinogen III oxidase [Kordiimonadaceae bacterium]